MDCLKKKIRVGDFVKISARRVKFKNFIKKKTVSILIRLRYFLSKLDSSLILLKKK